MEENITYNFLDQIPIAFFKPSAYRKLLGLKKKCLVGFVMFVIALSFLLEYGIPFAAWTVSVGGIENLLTNGVPDFTLENGVLEMEQPMEIQMDPALLIKVDTDVDQFTQKDLGETTMEEILFSKTNVIVKHASKIYEVKFADYKHLNANNASLLDLVPMLRVSLVFSFFVVFLTKVATYLVSAFFFASLCRIGVRTKEGQALGVLEVFCFAIYARSLFVLLTSLNICLGYVIDSLLLTVVGVFLTMRYIYRAELAYIDSENVN